MLDYGRLDQGPLERGIGDFGDKIRAGRVVAPATREVGGGLPPSLGAIAEAWGYPVTEVVS